LKIATLSSKKLGDVYEGALKNNYLYNDKELFDDADLNWYDYGFRNYDPQIGRFPQLDPLSFDYPYYTPYQYSGCEPIANVDVDGLEPFGSIGGLASDVPTGVLAFTKTLDAAVVTTKTASKVLIAATKASNTILFKSGTLFSIANLAVKTINTATQTSQAGKNVPIVKHQSLSPKREVVNGKVAGSKKSNSPTMAFSTTAPDPRATIIAGAAVIALYTTIGIIKMATSDDVSGYGSYPDHSLPDNTIYNRPIYETPEEKAPPFDGQQLKAEDQTDHMGKSKGNTSGNNQAQNKQVEALAKKFELSRDEQQRLHRRISGEGYGYKEIEEIIKTKDY